MIKHILNIIKGWFYKEEQDPHMYQYEIKEHCDKHSKYKHRCIDCQEVIK